MKILFVQPPVYDFACHDFWMKPYGFLRLAGLFRAAGHVIEWFDFLDRSASDCPSRLSASHPDGRGRYPRRTVVKPAIFSAVPRMFKRYGRDSDVFSGFVNARGPFDAVFLTCTMTYWYLGVAEIAARFSGVPVYVGGGYATLCAEHARSLGVIPVSFKELPQFLASFGIGAGALETAQPAWDVYPQLPYVAARMSWGCPRRCSYCAIGQFSDGFTVREPQTVADEVNTALRPETMNVAFYDDALLANSDALFDVCGRILSRKQVSFHTPNGVAVNAITSDVARELNRHRFGTLFLGYEVSDNSLQRRTGGKTSDEAFQQAAAVLRGAGFQPGQIYVYLLLGHDLVPPATVAQGIRQVLAAGFLPSLSEFSPIPGTPDGDRLLPPGSDPLLTNNSAWTLRWAAPHTVQRLKDLAHQRDAVWR